MLISNYLVVSEVTVRYCLATGNGENDSRKSRGALSPSIEIWKTVNKSLPLPESVYISLMQ